MNKIEALENLNKFIEKHCIEEELPELLQKFEQMTDNDFSECTSSGQVYHKIVGWSKPKAKRKPKAKPESQPYYKISIIDEVTDKAYGIVTGCNNLHGKNYRTFIQWIPQSQCKKIDKQIYIPAWMVATEGLWDFVEKESKINL